MHHPERLGRFSLPFDLVMGKDPRALAFLASCVVLRAELMAYNLELEYMGICPLFDEIEQGELVPDYHILFPLDAPTEARRLA